MARIIIRSTPWKIASSTPPTVKKMESFMKKRMGRDTTIGYITPVKSK